MKKIITLTLSIILMLSVSITASASSGYDELKSLNTNTDKSTKEIEAIYKEETDAVYHVMVTWNNDKVLYDSKGKTWDSEELEYVISEEEGEWDGYIDVLITNRSNVEVYPCIEFTPAYDYDINTMWEEDAGSGARMDAGDINFAHITMNSAAVEGVSESNLPNIWMKGTFSGDLKTIVKNSNGTLSAENPIKVGTVTITLSSN